MGAFLGVKLRHNMGAFFSKNLTLNMIWGPFQMKIQRITWWPSSIPEQT